MKRLQSVCVFCASSNHIPDIYRETTETLGKELAKREIELIYGGGNNGLMGVLAESVYNAGGRIVGVIPEGLRNLGYAYSNVDEMVVTPDLRKRKAIMEERADGFICLAGGFGTLEETLEIITLRQLGMLDKPIVLINTGDFFRGLIEQFAQMCSERFCEQNYTDLYDIADTPFEALDNLTMHMNETLRKSSGWQDIQS